LGKLIANRKHLEKVASLGCIVCRNLGLGETPANAHHINCKGMAMKSDDFETIPLCSGHHQYADGTAKFQGHIAVHKSLEKFEERYGTERELLEQTLIELGVDLS
jgi:Recombination enhancement, RecA-dependent nuclease